MTDIGRPHMPTFGTGVPRSALRVPGVPLNITDGTNFDQLRRQLSTPDYVGPRLGQTIERESNGFVRATVIVRAAASNSHKRIDKYQLVFCKNSSSQKCWKELISTLNLAQMNDLLKSNYETAMKWLFSGKQNEESKDAMDSLNHHIYEELEDELTRKRRAHKEKQSDAFQTDPIKKKFVNAPTSAWRNVEELRKEYDNFQHEHGLWSLNADSILETWNFAGAVYHAAPEDDFTTATVIYSGLCEIDNCIGPNLYAGASLFMTLKRYFNSVTQKYEHFYFEILPSQFGNISEKTFQSRYPDFIERSYTGVTGYITSCNLITFGDLGKCFDFTIIALRLYTEYGKIIYIGEVLKTDETKEQKNKNGVISRKLAGITANEHEAWDLHKKQCLDRLQIDLRAKRNDRHMF